MLSRFFSGLAKFLLIVFYIQFCLSFRNSSLMSCRNLALMRLFRFSILSIIVTLSILGCLRDFMGTKSMYVYMARWSESIYSLRHAPALLNWSSCLSIIIDPVDRLVLDRNMSMVVFCLPRILSLE